MPVLRTLYLGLLLFLPLQVHAEAMVLLQGYLGDGDGWRRSGVADVLVGGGWLDGGHLVNGPQGIMRLGGPELTGARRFYTVAIDTEAPLLVQERQLVPYLHEIRSRHAGESLYLVGHSAGGVLARLYMVQHPGVRISALITVASPHLGTATAEAGLFAGQSPLGWVAPLFGAEALNRSQGLYFDLAREQSGNLLFWLNRQPHPASRYISVVRSESGFFGVGDVVVPPWSQDMNNVAALRGRVHTLTVDGMHNLMPSDGRMLLDILRHLQTS
jgi:pimeloyl-ACP methyl ester carboxylesterase